MDTLRFLDYGIYFIDGKSPGGVGALSYYPDSMNGLDRGFRDAVVFGNPEFEKIVGNQSIGFVTYEAESLFFIVQQRRENEFDPRSGAPRPFQQYRYILISNEELQESYEKGREIFFEIINQHPKKMQDDPFILPTYEQAGGLLHPEPVFKPKELSSSPMLRLRSIKIKNKILAIVNEISQYPDHQIRVLDDQVPLVEKLFIAQEVQRLVYPLIGPLTFALDNIANPLAKIKLQFISSEDVANDSLPNIKFRLLEDAGSIISEENSYASAAYNFFETSWKTASGYFQDEKFKTILSNKQPEAFWGELFTDIRNIIAGPDKPVNDFCLLFYYRDLFNHDLVVNESFELFKEIDKSNSGMSSFMRKNGPEYFKFMFSSLSKQDWMNAFFEVKDGFQEDWRPLLKEIVQDASKRELDEIAGIFVEDFQKFETLDNEVSPNTILNFFAVDNLDWAKLVLDKIARLKPEENQTLFAYVLLELLPKYPQNQLADLKPTIEPLFKTYANLEGTQLTAERGSLLIDKAASNSTLLFIYLEFVGRYIRVITPQELDWVIGQLIDEETEAWAWKLIDKQLNHEAPKLSEIGDKVASDLFKYLNAKGKLTELGKRAKKNLYYLLSGLSGLSAPTAEMLEFCFAQLESIKISNAEFDIKSEFEKLANLVKRLDPASTDKDLLFLVSQVDDLDKSLWDVVKAYGREDLFIEALDYAFQAYPLRGASYKLTRTDLKKVFVLKASRSFPALINKINESSAIGKPVLSAILREGDETELKIWKEVMTSGVWANTRKSIRTLDFKKWLEDQEIKGASIRQVYEHLRELEIHHEYRDALISRFAEAAVDRYEIREEFTRLLEKCRAATTKLSSFRKKELDFKYNFLIMDFPAQGYAHGPGPLYEIVSKVAFSFDDAVKDDLYLGLLDYLVLCVQSTPLVPSYKQNLEIGMAGGEDLYRLKVLYKQEKIDEDFIIELLKVGMLDKDRITKIAKNRKMREAIAAFDKERIKSQRRRVTSMPGSQKGPYTQPKNQSNISIANIIIGAIFLLVVIVIGIIGFDEVANLFSADTTLNISSATPQQADAGMEATPESTTESILPTVTDEPTQPPSETPAPTEEKVSFVSVKAQTALACYESPTYVHVIDEDGVTEYEQDDELEVIAFTQYQNVITDELYALYLVAGDSACWVLGEFIDYPEDLNNLAYLTQESIPPLLELQSGSLKCYTESIYQDGGYINGGQPIKINISSINPEDENYKYLIRDETNTRNCWLSMAELDTKAAAAVYHFLNEAEDILSGGIGQPTPIPAVTFTPTSTPTSTATPSPTAVPSDTPPPSPTADAPITAPTNTEVAVNPSETPVASATETPGDQTVVTLASPNKVDIPCNNPYPMMPGPRQPAAIMPGIEWKQTWVDFGAEVELIAQTKIEIITWDISEINKREIVAYKIKASENECWIIGDFIENLPQDLNLPYISFSDTSPKAYLTTEQNKYNFDNNIQVGYYKTENFKDIERIALLRYQNFYDLDEMELDENSITLKIRNPKYSEDTDGQPMEYWLKPEQFKGGLFTIIRYLDE